MIRPKDPLEIEADKILAEDLKDKRRNKSKLKEYPILSDSQLARRRSMEVPFSSLSRKQSNRVDDNEDNS